MPYFRFDALANAQVLAVRYLGVVLGIFDALAEHPKSTANAIAKNCELDPIYTRRWLEAAASMNLVCHVDDQWSLATRLSTETRPTDDQYIAEVIQSIYSVLIADAAIPLFRSGEQPGYAIVNRFANLVPYYPTVGAALYGDRFSSEVLPAIFKNSDMTMENGTAADFWGGDGYLLKRLISVLPRWKGHIVGGSPNNIAQGAAIEAISDDKFSSANSGSYDIILASRVVHHFGATMHDKLSLFYRLLKPGGVLCIWDFAWPKDPSDKNLARAGDLAFLNLIEHIQGNCFLTKQKMQTELEVVGFQPRYHALRDGRESLVVAKRPVAKSERNPTDG
jgi:hypothetical protein